jgi:short-subunit dehydrogenase
MMGFDSELDLRGAVIVLTGAASGIGAALAPLLARRGAHLALADVDGTALAASAESARGHNVTVSTHVIDLAQPDAAVLLHAAVIAEHGRASILINNAGVALGGSFAQVPEADFDWLMSINFGAVVRLTREFLPTLARERAAQIVNVSSIFGIVAPPGQTAYCASKFAVRGFSESLRHELRMAASPVGVTLVHPGGVRTRIAESARIAPAMSAAEAAQQQRAARQLLILPPDVAAARIVRGIERREPRVLVGRDAMLAAWLQRLFPIGYWAHMARGIARRIGHDTGKEAA